MNARMVVTGLMVTLIAVLATLAGATALAQPQGAQVVRTPSGFSVEEVKVGGSCVVIVSRVGAGASDDVAAVPCR